MLDVFIRYKELEKVATFDNPIYLKDGKPDNNDPNDITFVFDITKKEFNQLNSLENKAKIDIGGSDYDCEILHIKEDRVKIRTYGYEGKAINEAKILFDNKFIVEKQIEALSKLKENQYWLGYLFKNMPIQGGTATNCDFSHGKPILNEEQKTAVRYATGVKDIYLQWGPPGTGKTSTIPSIVRNWLKSKPRKKVLICSYTNKAVDNVITHLFGEFRDKIIRFGPSTLSDNYDSVFLNTQIDAEKKKIDSEYRKQVGGAEKKLRQKQGQMEKRLQPFAKAVIEKNREITKKLSMDIRLLEDKLGRLSNSMNDKESWLEEKKQYIIEYESTELEIRGLNDELTRAQKKTSELNSIKNRIVSRLFRSDDKRIEEIELLRKERSRIENQIIIEKRRLEVLLHRRNAYENMLMKLESIRRECRETQEEHNRYCGLRDGLGRPGVSKLFGMVYDDLEGISPYRQLVNDLKPSFQGYFDRKAGLIQDEAAVESLKKEVSRIRSAWSNALDSITRAILMKKDAIITTNLRVCQKIFNDIEFDLVIMDEAGSIDIPAAVIPMLKTKKIILVGDHKQLRPIPDTKREDQRTLVNQNEYLNMSIFEWFHNDDFTEKNETMLRKQYRMVKPIADFVSEAFYSGRLQTPHITRKPILTDTDDPLTSRDYPFIYFNRKFKDFRPRTGSRYSTAELHFIGLLVREFKKRYGESIENEIGIITPFSKQRRMIEKRFPNISCGSVHTFQGQEQPIIVFATTRYNTYNFGPMFTDEYKNLLNVAVSRAAEKFILVADPGLFDFSPNYYGRLFQHIRKHGKEIRDQFVGRSKCPYCGDLKPVEQEACRDCIRTILIDVLKHKTPASIQTLSGRLVRSEGERLVDDWLHNHGINALYEQQIREFQDYISNSIIKFYDWYIPAKKVYIELWGSPHKADPRNRLIKERLYAQAGLRLISLEQNDLENPETLDKVMKAKLGI